MAVNPQAVLPPPPVTWPPWAKAVWFITNTVVTGAAWIAFDYGDEINALEGGAEDPPAHTWRRFQVTAADTLSTDLADDLAFTFDLINYTNGVVDNTWTQGDYDAVHASLSTFLTAYAPQMSSRYQFSGWKAYVMSFNGYSFAKPFADTGAPENAATLAISGGSAGTMPPQPRCTVTEITSSRPNWGRFYMPPTAGTSIASTGRLTTTVVDAIATAAETFYGGLASQQLVPVVPTTSVGKAPKRTLQSVTAVQVDDVIDVQRSGRHKHVLYRKRIPVSTE